MITIKSEWRVTSQMIGGVRKYAVYRLLDVNALDHSGNREFAGDYIADKGAAEAATNALNALEELEQSEHKEVR